MKIQKIVSQHRRDFHAIYECEHCGHTYKGSGYDDSFFHSTVIPAMECNACGKMQAKSIGLLVPNTQMEWLFI